MNFALPIQKINFVFLLLMCLAGFQFLLVLKGGPDAETEGGDQVRQIVTLSLFLVAVAAALAGSRWRAFAAVPPSLAVLLAWMTASILWAESPDYALRRTIFAAIVLVTPLIAIRQIGVETAYRLFAGVLAVIVAADLVAVLIWPEATHAATEWYAGLDGDWKGLHTQKNSAGSVAGAFLITTLTGVFHRRSPWSMAGAALAALLLLGSQSKTAIIISLVAAAVGFAFTHSTRGSITRAIVMTALLALAAAVAVAVAFAGNEVWERFWNPENFTGRMEIWRLLLQYSSEHFWLGSGFGSFWRIGADGPALTMSGGWAAQSPNGHNGYLDLQAELGFIGLVLGTFAFAVPVIWALSRNTSLSSEMRFSAIALLTFFLARNFFETGFFSEHQIPLWAMAASIAAHGHKRQPVGVSPGHRAAPI